MNADVLVAVVYSKPPFFTVFNKDTAGHSVGAAYL